MISNKREVAGLGEIHLYAGQSIKTAACSRRSLIFLSGLNCRKSSNHRNWFCNNRLCGGKMSGNVVSRKETPRCFLEVAGNVILRNSRDFGHLPERAPEYKRRIQYSSGNRFRLLLSSLQALPKFKLMIFDRTDSNSKACCEQPLLILASFFEMPVIFAGCPALPDRDYGRLTGVAWTAF